MVACNQCKMKDSIGFNSKHGYLCKSCFKKIHEKYTVEYKNYTAPKTASRKRIYRLRKNSSSESEIFKKISNLKKMLPYGWEL